MVKINTEIDGIEREGWFMKKFLCKIGLHSWKSIDALGTFFHGGLLQKCRKCSKERTVIVGR